MQVLEVVRSTNPTPKSISFYIDKNNPKIPVATYTSYAEVEADLEKWLAKLPVCCKKQGEITYSVLEAH